jgi:redox-sensitive bicupin YhaK (pirin superfamily)
MATRTQRDAPYVIRRAADHVVLGEAEFGSPGLEALEIIGPYNPVRALGPLITVHDARVQPHAGIEHHPHRMNERLFYIMQGELDHDDRLNEIRGHLETGDVGIFTEGRHGMLHSEWNNGDDLCHAFILVYPTRPVPEQTAFSVFPSNLAPVYKESGGIETKELLGPRAQMGIHGDLHLFTDSSLKAGARLELGFEAGQGGLVSIQEGSTSIDGQQLAAGDSVLFPPLDQERTFGMESGEGARVIRVVHGPGLGFVADG